MELTFERPYALGLPPFSDQENSHGTHGTPKYQQDDS